MSDGVPTSGRRRGLRLCLWLLPVWLPALVLLVVCLWLVSPIGRGWVEGRIRGLTGLDARVGAVMVTPWNGISLGRVELLQPPALRPLLKTPLFSAAEIRINPVWKSWLHGKLELRAIEFDSPRCMIAVEMLGGLARPQASAPPVLPPAAPPVAGPVNPLVPVPDQPVSAAPQAPVRSNIPDAVLAPTAWIHLKNGSFTVVSAALGVKRCELAGIDASIPVAGKAARSGLNVGSIRIWGKPVLTGFSAVLDWQAPVLSMVPAETTVAGLKVEVAGITALASGLPVQVEFRVPKQKTGEVRLARDASADAGTVTASGRFMGLALSPSTWQGDLVVESIASSARVGAQHAAFDRGRAVVVLRGGLLSCVDARLIGDDLSLLGNGTVLADGRLAAALRLVAPPDVASSIAARVSQGLPDVPVLTNLSTPQRSAFDVCVSGDVRHIFLRLGADGPVIEYNPSISP